MTVIAVIPARGGSKGIPRKNLRSVGGVPLVGRTVAAARGARLVDNVYVSTDDDAIAQVARGFGANIIRRPDHLATDTASSESALRHALQLLEHDGILVTHLAMLQCTSPFTTSADIDCVIEAVLGSSAPSAFAVVPDHSFLWRVGPDGFACGINHDHALIRQRRQIRAPQYRETGAIYVVDVKAFKTTGNRFCGATLAVPVNAPPIEIDEEADLTISDALAAAREAREGGTPPTIIGAVAVDFEGVHAEDVVFLDDGPRLGMRLHRADAIGLERLRAAGYRLLILSRSHNDQTIASASKLQIPFRSGVEDKRCALEEWGRAEALPLESMCYLGTDLDDLDCLTSVGWGCAPISARAEVKAVAGYVSPFPGGCGAFGDIAERILVRAPSSGDP